MRKVKNKWIFIACFCLCASFISGNTNSKFGLFYPFVSIEKNIFVSEIEYEDNWEPTVFTHWNMVAGGIQYQKSIFFSSLSFAGLWKENVSLFLPAFNVNLGIHFKNVYIYGGKNISLFKNNERIFEDEIIELTDPLYVGGKYLFPIGNIGLECGAQISRGKLNRIEQEAYFACAINSRISYEVTDWLFPYISLAVEKYDFCKDLSVNVGIGAFIGRSNRMPGSNPPVQKTFRAIVYKPNIYLYPEVTTKIFVAVKPNGKITTSIPPYSNGWNVLAHPDGTIENTDGFLFYEAEVSIHHSEKGWCIPMSGLEMFFENTLKKYGFNDREIKDFVDYWTQYLPISSFYAIYPVTGKSLEKICPLNIKPKPDNILRLWFVFSPLSEIKDLDAPKIRSFERTGYVAAEWGGIIKK